MVTHNGCKGGSIHTCLSALNNLHATLPEGALEGSLTLPDWLVALPWSALLSKSASSALAARPPLVALPLPRPPLPPCSPPEYWSAREGCSGPGVTRSAPLRLWLRWGGPDSSLGLKRPSAGWRLPCNTNAWLNLLLVTVHLHLIMATPALCLLQKKPLGLNIQCT